MASQDNRDPARGAKRPPDGRRGARGDGAPPVPDRRTRASSTGRSSRCPSRSRPPPGVPTNAIFGFASMLVKIVTDYGVCPTVVAWDAGTSGRTEMFAEYKAQRRSRPDLLKQQWPAMEPLVEAFGYRNVKVEGYEADDVIASLAERALQSDPPVPVMIVTGDRDVFQLIDEDGLVKVMATSRGITETKIYDRQAVIDRYGIAPRADPRLLRAEGRHLRQHPGRPRHRRQDGERADPEVRLARGGARARRRDRAAPSAKQNLVEHAQDARISKQLATVRRDVAGRLRRRARRPRASPTARACARCSVATSCATRCGAWKRRWRTPSSPRPHAAAEVDADGARARGRARRHRDARRPSRRDLCWRVRETEPPRGRAVRRGSALALRGRPRAARCWRASARGPSRWRGACGERARRRARREGARAGAAGPRARHAARARTCSSPRVAATRSTSCARSAASAATSRTLLAADARDAGRARRLAARADRRAWPGGRDARHRAAARARAARDGAARRAPRPRAGWRRSPSACARRSRPRT